MCGSAAVCGSVRGSVWQCSSARGSVLHCGTLRQCGSLRQYCTEYHQSASQAQEGGCCAVCASYITVYHHELARRSKRGDDAYLLHYYMINQLGVVGEGRLYNVYYCVLSSISEKQSCASRRGRFIAYFSCTQACAKKGAGAGCCEASCIHVLFFYYINSCCYE